MKVGSTETKYTTIPSGGLLLSFSRTFMWPCTVNGAKAPSSRARGRWARPRGGNHRARRHRDCRAVASHVDRPCGIRAASDLVPRVAILGRWPAVAYSVAVSSVIMRCCAVVIGLASKVLEEDPAKGRVLRVHNDIVVDGKTSRPIIYI